MTEKIDATDVGVVKHAYAGAYKKEAAGHRRKS